MNRALRLSETTLKRRSGFVAICDDCGSARFELVADFREELLGLRRFRRLFVLLAGKPVQCADRKEKQERNDDKFKCDREKTSPSQYGTLFFCLHKGAGRHLGRQRDV